MLCSFFIDQHLLATIHLSKLFMCGRWEQIGTLSSVFERAHKVTPREAEDPYRDWTTTSTANGFVPQRSLVGIWRWKHTRCKRLGLVEPHKNTPCCRNVSPVSRSGSSSSERGCFQFLPWPSPCAFRLQLHRMFRATWEPTSTNQPKHSIFGAIWLPQLARRGSGWQSQVRQEICSQAWRRNGQTLGYANRSKQLSFHPIAEW